MAKKKKKTEQQAYVGIKVVNAEPMHKDAYCTMRGWPIPEDEEGMEQEREGYLLIHENGYVAWQAKSEFEANFMPVKDINQTTITEASLQLLSERGIKIKRKRG